MHFLALFSLGLLTWEEKKTQSILSCSNLIIFKLVAIKLRRIWGGIKIGKQKSEASWKTISKEEYWVFLGHRTHWKKSTTEVL